MNSTELAALLFPFDPNTDRIVFYATTIAYSLTAMWNVVAISYKLTKKCVQFRCSERSPFTKLEEVSVVPANGHEIQVEPK